MRKLLIGVLGSLVAVVGFASTANASASIDLIWAGSGTDLTTPSSSSSIITLNVILTAGPLGSQGAGVSVVYSGADVSVISFASNQTGPLPMGLGTTTDNGSIVSNVNAASFPPFVGSGLAAFGVHQLGTIQFHVGPGGGTITPVFVNTDAVLTLGGAAAVVTVNSAFIGDHAIPEPATATLLALGLGGLAFAGRRR